MYLKTMDMEALVDWTLRVGNRKIVALASGVTDGFDPNRGSDQDDHQRTKSDDETRVQNPQSCA